MNNPSRIGKVISGSPHAKLLLRARVLMALDAQLHELLPAPLNEHCSVLNFRDTTLVLAADSPVWAARLRFHTAQLVKQLSGHQTVTVRTVRIRVQPPSKPHTPEHRPAASGPSARGAAVIRQAASSISDPELKSALLRLASSHKHH